MNLKKIYKEVDDDKPIKVKYIKEELEDIVQQ